MPIGKRTLLVMASHVGFDSLTAVEEASQIGRGTIRRWIRGEGIPTSALRAIAWQLEKPVEMLEILFAVVESPSSSDDEEPLDGPIGAHQRREPRLQLLQRDPDARHAADAGGSRGRVAVVGAGDAGRAAAGLGRHDDERHGRDRSR
jgi:hypothetical protein